MTEAERLYQNAWNRAKQQRWRQHGNCVRCGTPAGINRSTGRPYAHCWTHRVVAAAHTKRYLAKKPRPLTRRRNGQAEPVGLPRPSARDSDAAGRP